MDGILESAESVLKDICKNSPTGTAGGRVKKQSYDLTLRLTGACMKNKSIKQLARDWDHALARASEEQIRAYESDEVELNETQSIRIRSTLKGGGQSTRDTMNRYCTWPIYCN
jgi:hypothetical protein